MRSDSPHTIDNTILHAIISSIKNHVRRCRTFDKKIMNYQIIGDSCCDFTEEMKADSHFVSVPLTLELPDYSVTDDYSFDQLDFLKRVKACPTEPKTACPSPEAFEKAIENSPAEEIYVVTISEHLSGSYQSAMVGKQLFEEAHPDLMGKKIHICGSDSASSGQCKLCLEIKACKDKGMLFDETVSYIETIRKDMQTYFVLESLETLRKNGRLSAVQYLLVSALNIKPVMGADGGVIVKRDQTRGMNRALKRMVELAVERAGGPEKAKGKMAVITHVNCPERAELVKKTLLSAADFREVVITNAQGVATVYANDGGIVLAV